MGRWGSGVDWRRMSRYLEQVKDRENEQVEQKKIDDEERVFSICCALAMQCLHF